MTEPKSVFFDLDGTLTDPQEGIVACIQHALNRLEIAIDPEIDLKTFIGPPLRASFVTLCQDKDIAERAVSIYRERFSTIGLFENELYDGIVESLETINRKLDSVFVVTSKPTVYAQRIIRHFALDSFFRRVYGSHLDGRLSDKTALLAHVLKREKISPENAVMIGDRKYDITGAAKNGVRSIGVAWGYGSEQELLEAGADLISYRPIDLPEQVFNVC
ncbi:MAG: HAD hydrolase-like protein [Pseudomonadota bacterium]